MRRGRFLLFASLKVCFSLNKSAQTGLRAGDVVLEIDRKPDRNADEDVKLRLSLAVAVVALRQPRRVQRRNASHRPLGLQESFAPLDAALLVAARRVLPRF